MQKLNVVLVWMVVCLLWSPCVSYSAGHGGDLELTSPVMRTGTMLTNQQVLAGFGCSGENISPELQWANLPEHTRSLALTMYDPDAPTGSGWWHWVVFNIPADTTGLVQGAGNADGSLLPRGAVQSRTDFGSAGYGGACPPQGHGVHHYQFTLHALDVDKLDLAPDAPAAMVGFYLGAHTLEKTTLTPVYKR